MPAVSVVIPTYNRPHTLAELLEALSRQTFRNFEVHIVNDAGIKVEEVVGLYPELDVKVINLPVNSYHVWARNAAIPYFSGEWVMPIDDDDLIVPDHIEVMLSQSADVDLVYGDAEIFEYTLDPSDTGGLRVPTGRFLFAYRHEPGMFRRHNTYIASGSLYRKELHHTLGPFDPAVRNYWDWDWMLRVMGGGHRVKKVPRAGVLYAYDRKGGSNQSSCLAQMRSYLEKLCLKHGFGPLDPKNFYLMLEEEELRSSRSASEIVWDGKPFVSRYSLKSRVARNRS